MKFGVRECCDVVLRAKGTQKVGNKIFYKNEPVIYFDTLKTSSLEGSATTTYAQGGKGNARLMSWDGERTLTWTMEDALISPIGLMILTGAGLVESSSTTPITVHTTEQLELKSGVNCTIDSGDNYCEIILSEIPYDAFSQKYMPASSDTDQSDSFDALRGAYAEDYIYVMRLDSNGDICTEPFLGSKKWVKIEDKYYDVKDLESYAYNDTTHVSPKTTLTDAEAKTIYVKPRQRIDEAGNVWDYHILNTTSVAATTMQSHTIAPLVYNDVVLVDYYRQELALGGAQEIQITPDKFGGSYYLEASTLFRNEDGIDMPAEFIIPNCRIQSNFTFSMSSSGDPSSFTFTMDCFPDYTRFDHTKKVLAAIQVITTGTGAGNELMRLETNHHGKYIYEDSEGVVHDSRYEGNEATGGVAITGTTEGQVNGYATTATPDAEG